MYKAFDNEMNQDLLENGVIYLSGKLNHGRAAEVERAIARFNTPTPPHERKEEILLYLDCNAEQVIVALDIVNAIRSSKVPVTGIVYQQARYAGAIILLACHKRVAMQHALIQFSPVIVTDLTFEDIEGNLYKRLRRSRRAQMACIKILAERTRHRKLVDAWKFIKSESALTADDALGEGIVDTVLYTAPPFLPYFGEQIIKTTQRQF